MKHIKNFISSIILIVLMTFTLSACNTNTLNSQINDNKNATNNDMQDKNSNSLTDNKLEIDYIDVGQADSILISNNNHFILIDTGNREDGQTVLSYLEKKGIKELDYLVLTHPHEDHIGSASTIIKSLKIDKIYAPKVTTTTATFKNMLLAVKAKNMAITNPRVGDSFSLGGAKLTILAPNSTKYEDLNNYSIVLRMVYGDKSFLFMGDAEGQSEKEISANGINVSSDVIKIGHHGSSSSSTENFLNKIKCKYAIISCGVGNDYHHPQEITMKRLKARNITVYRIDECKTIELITDGKTIKFNTNPGDYRDGDEVSFNNETSSTTTNQEVKQVQPAVDVKIYVDSNGNGLIKGNINSSGEKIYHLPGGAYYNKTKPEAWFKTEKEAQAAGYRKSQK